VEDVIHATLGFSRQIAPYVNQAMDGKIQNIKNVSPIKIVVPHVYQMERSGLIRHLLEMDNHAPTRDPHVHMEEKNLEIVMAIGMEQMSQMLAERLTHLLMVTVILIIVLILMPRLLRYIKNVARS
jgi:hypothetical protein